MLTYIEYISRRPSAPRDGFHAAVARGQEGWAVEYQEDRLLLNVGRTWRIGPEPEYMAVWYTPDSGLERFTEWERVFVSGEADAFEKPFELAARIDFAGCYEPLLEPVPGSGGPYYAEFFDWAPDATRERVREVFERRAADLDGLVLNLVVDRIGHLGPEPRGVAFWALGDFANLDAVARDLVTTNSVVRLVRSGLYADLGDEIL